MVQRTGVFTRQLVVAVAYGIAYTLLRKLGFAHFVPIAGLKLSVLLLAPRRYWPALLVVETALLAYSLEDCITPLGWSFYLFSIIPPIALVMVVVALCRSQLQGLTLSHFRLSSLLICIVASSAVLVADGLLSASLVPASVPRKPLAELLPDYFLGTYAGMLAVVPLVLSAALEWHKHRSFKRIWNSNRSLLEAALVALSAVALEVAALSQTESATARFVGQAMLFIPAAYFSMRWGWKGAAIIGMVTSVGIVLLMPGMFDVATLMAQTMLALFLTTFIVLGLQTTKLKHALKSTEGHLKRARLEHQLSEVKLQRSSFELGFAQVELTKLHRHLLIQLDGGHHGRELEQHKDALSQITFRLNELASALAPPMGASHPHAFSDGPIAKLLEKHHIGYEATLNGQWSLLSKNALSMLYRLACESIGYLLKQYPTDHIVLTTHTENLRDVLVIRLSVLSNGSPVAAPGPNAVMKGLGTFDLPVDELRVRAQLFHGDVLVSPGRVQVVLQQDLTER